MLRFGKSRAASFTNGLITDSSSAKGAPGNVQLRGQRRPHSIARDRASKMRRTETDKEHLVEALDAERERSEVGGSARIHRERRCARAHTARQRTRLTG